MDSQQGLAEAVDLTAVVVLDLQVGRRKEHLTMELHFNNSSKHVRRQEEAAVQAKRRIRTEYERFGRAT
jgi:hypothetical protein